MIVVELLGMLVTDFISWSNWDVSTFFHRMFYLLSTFLLWKLIYISAMQNAKMYSYEVKH